MQSVIEKIRAAITPSSEAMGYRIVQIKFTDGNRSRSLQIMAERLADGKMLIEDCEALSRQVSAVLDVEDMVPGAYRLEISSPGIDRPLVRAEDYAAYLGHLAKLETHFPLHGRKRFSGTLKTMENGLLTLQSEDGTSYEIPLADIATAKLVLTDALIKLATRARDAEGKSPAKPKKTKAK